MLPMSAILLWSSTFSCYQILDSNVSVWNTARPYIPILSFPNHSDVITGKCSLSVVLGTLCDGHFFVDFLWLNDKEILSCSKDNRILVQTMNTTDRPVDHVVGISILTFVVVVVVVVAVV